MENFPPPPLPAPSGPPPQMQIPGVIYSLPAPQPAQPPQALLQQPLSPGFLQLSQQPLPGPQPSPLPANRPAPPPKPPPQNVHVPGLSDRRFEGVIDIYFASKGFGFIRCDELRATRFPDKDIFVHKHQMMNFILGDGVSFSVSLNSQGKPEVMELAGPGATKEDAAAMARTAFQAGGTGGDSPLMLGAPPITAEVQATVGHPAPPPPPSSSERNSQNQTNDFCVYEIEVPPLVEAGFRGENGKAIVDIVKLAGGDLSIALSNTQHCDDRVNKPLIATVRGTSVSAAMGAVLIEQRINDLMLA